MKRINWLLLSFDELSLRQLYTVMQLRQKVFVVEQNCVYLDADELDFASFHLLGFVDNQLAAYSRILPAGVGLVCPSIGRIIVAPEYRKLGLGKELMKESLSCLEKTFGKQKIMIHAQAHLEKFYEGFGFKRSSDIFFEDGIPHIEMLRDL